MYQLNFTHPEHIYFIGIGGISMSGLAEILLEKGFTVSGSDSQKSSLTELLESKGALIHYGQQAENIGNDIDLVVYTSAIHPDNPEYAAMKKMGIPSLTRAQLLGQMMKNYAVPIAISGTHGKTTTVLGDRCHRSRTETEIVCPHRPETDQDVQSLPPIPGRLS